MSKKYIVIGDIHGRTIWQDIVKENSDADMFVFLGDYMDPYNEDNVDISYGAMKQNLLNIIKFKKEKPDNVILLFGNHDIHYAYDFDYCSRYDFKNSKKIKELFNENIDLFQFAYQIDNHLFTHGGLTQNWFEWAKKYLIENDLNENFSNLADVLNKCGSDTSKPYINAIPARRGGYYPYGGITWADIVEHFDDNMKIQSLKNFHQYVGHNKVKFIYKSDIVGDDNTSITFCDVLHTPNETLKYNYLEIEI